MVNMNSSTHPSNSAETGNDFTSNFNTRFAQDMKRKMELIEEETKRCAHFRRLLTEANIAEFKREILKNPTKPLDFDYHYPAYENFKGKFSNVPEIKAAWDNRRKTVTQCPVDVQEVREMLAKDPDFQNAGLDVEFHMFPPSPYSRGRTVLIYKGKKPSPPGGFFRALSG